MDNALGYKYSYIEVDLRQIRENIRHIQEATDCGIIPVVKSNAWGQGTVPVARMLFEKAGFDVVAVAHVSEAAEIREAGFRDQTIMLLSGMPFHVIPYAVKYDLMMMVYNCETVERLSSEVRKAGLERFPIQIKIDTGFHRIGVPPEKLDELLDAIEAAGNLEIAGVCSHYADSYNPDSEKTPEQYELFKKMVAHVKARGITPRYISIGCSPDIDRPDEISTHMRVGWGYIAYTPAGYLADYHGNRPSLTLRAFITDMHELKAGDSLGYSNVVLDKPATTATISIGYGDGLYRPSTMHGGPLLIRGQYAHYLDECMDQTIIDVTGIDCKVGDEVTIYGKDKYSDAYLTPTEVSKYADGNSTILQLYLTDRIARIYVDEN
jgi:alanine racemase